MILYSFLRSNPINAQDWDRPGHAIGKVFTQGDLILLELDRGVLGKANLFDLSGRTLRFTPDGTAFRAENTALQWDSNFGSELKDPHVTLSNFAFPFSGKTWNSLFIDMQGAITFGAEQSGLRGGVPIGRFDQLAEAAPRLVNTVPAMCVFLKPRMSGARYVKNCPIGLLSPGI